MNRWSCRWPTREYLEWKQGTRRVKLFWNSQGGGAGVRWPATLEEPKPSQCFCTVSLASGGVSGNLPSSDSSQAFVIEARAAGVEMIMKISTFFAYLIP